MLTTLSQFLFVKQVRKSGSQVPLVYTVLETSSDLQGDDNVKYLSLLIINNECHSLVNSTPACFS